MNDPSNPADRPLFFSLDEAFMKAIESVKSLEAPWGSSVLNKLTGGFHPGDLAIVAGFPRAGKTAFCIDTAICAARAGKTVAYISLDSALSHIGLRFFCALTKHNIWRIQMGYLSERYLDCIQTEMQKPENLPIYFSDRTVSDVKSIRETARALKDSKGLDLLIIDSLHPLISNLGSPEEEKEMKREISPLMKSMAADYDCQILAVLPLGEEMGIFGSPGLQITMNSLWDLGLLARYIDLLMAIDLAGAPEHSSKHDEVEVVVLKNRYGRCAWYKIVFDRDTLSMTFVEDPLEDDERL